MGNKKNKKMSQNQAYPFERGLPICVMELKKKKPEEYKWMIALTVEVRGNRTLSGMNEVRYFPGKIRFLYRFYEIV